MICTCLIHFININSHLLLYSVIIVHFFASDNLYSTYILWILRGKKIFKKLHSKNCLLWKNCLQSVWLEGTTKTDWFTLRYPLTNAPGREKKLLFLLGVKKKKRKGNGPLINDSNCSKLIEYIIHRHPLPTHYLLPYPPVPW